MMGRQKLLRILIGCSAMRPISQDKTIAKPFEYLRMPVEREEVLMGQEVPFIVISENIIRRFRKWHDQGVCVQFPSLI